MYLDGLKGEREEEGRREGGERRRAGKGESQGREQVREEGQDTTIRLPRGHNGVVHVDRTAESDAALGPPPRVTRNIESATERRSSV